jgi:alpha-tubulin suppressor-like RCC1 family protein
MHAKSCNEISVFPNFTGVSAIAIATGRGHACAILTGGGIKCWGKNMYGQLGIGSTVQQNSPTDVIFDAGSLFYTRRLLTF